MQKENKEYYVLETIKKIANEAPPKKIKVALVGLGPHAKRIYSHYFQKHKINLALVVELEELKESVKSYLLENGFKKTQLFTIENKLKDKEKLPKKIEQKLLNVCKSLNITHFIISTEPKAHYMYLTFTLKYHYPVLTDKPITVNKKMQKMKNIKKLKKQYLKLIKLSNKTNTPCYVMCQRKYHKGYEYIKKIASEIVVKYQIPITYINIYHCDGAWEMPHDLLKENHPYKYGYGKLFHSGYHFIDVLSDLLKINNNLKESKKITKGEVYSSRLSLNDELAIFNKEDYQRLFKTLPSYYSQEKFPKFNKFGEKNFYGSLDFKNKKNQQITHCNLNLLHDGFSRRSWIKTRNFYKENGRVRHEYLNIQIGPLMNIQVHSYQSKEIKDRVKGSELEEEFGGLEHFDIHIFRNKGMIGGKAHEIIKLRDLYKKKEKHNSLGYNELAREDYLKLFFKGKSEKGELKEHQLGIEILTSCAKSLKKKKKPIKIKVKKALNNSIDLKHYKKYVKEDYRNKERVHLKEYVKYTYYFSVYIALEKIKESDTYLTFISLSTKKKSIGGLLAKESSNKIQAFLRFNLLKLLVTVLKLETILKIIEKH